MVDLFDFAGARDDADELIAEFGQSVSLRRATASGGTAWEPTQSTTDYFTVAAVVDYSSREIDGNAILRTDRRALVSAGPLTEAGITLSVADKLVIDGAAWQIVRSMPLNPAGVTVVYDVQIRA